MADHSHDDTWAPPLNQNLQDIVDYINNALAHLTGASFTGDVSARTYVSTVSQIAGPPTTGTFTSGQWTVDRTGLVWFCTISGTPGTWASSTGGGHELGYAEYASPVAWQTDSIGTEGDVTGLSMSVTIGVRPIVLEFWGHVSGGSTWSPIVKLYEGATLLCTGTIPNGAELCQLNVKKRLAPSVGTHIYKVRFTSSAAQQSTMVGTATNPAYLQAVEC